MPLKDSYKSFPIMRQHAILPAEEVVTEAHVTLYSHPFEGFPVLRSHLQPHFVIYNGGKRYPGIAKMGHLYNAWTQPAGVKRKRRKQSKPDHDPDDGDNSSDGDYDAGPQSRKSEKSGRSGRSGPPRRSERSRSERSRSRGRGRKGKAEGQTAIGLQSRKRKAEGQTAIGSESRKWKMARQRESTDSNSVLSGRNLCRHNRLFGKGGVRNEGIGGWLEKIRGKP